MTDQPHEPPGFDAGEQEMADGLSICRPIPAAAFRGRLGRHLADNDPGYGPRPERLHLIVAGYMGAGGLLIALAGLLLS